jgi:hypothetical protein
LGCCDLELEEMHLYRMVAKVKNEHRTGKIGGIIKCHLCDGILIHEFIKKHLIGFSVHIMCPHCGFEFRG